MQELDLLNLKLEQVGKLEKFEVLKEIFTFCFKQRDVQIFKYYDIFLELLEEYLIFDENPSESFRNLISTCFKDVFTFIRASVNNLAFEKYYPGFVQYRYLISNNTSLAIILNCVSYFYWMKQDSVTCIKLLEESLELANNFCSTEVLPARYTTLGYIYECMGEMDQAEDYYQQGLDFAKKHNFEKAIIMAYDAMGRLFFARELYDKAIEYFQASLILHRDESKSLDKVSVQCNLASAFMYNNQPKQAMLMFEKAKKDWVKQEAPELYYSILANSGINYGRMKEYKKAEQNLLSALEFSNNNKAMELMLISNLELGILHQEKGELISAESSFKIALKLATETENEKQLLRTYSQMAELMQSKADWKRAIDYLTIVKQLSKKQKNVTKISETVKLLAFCFENLEQYEKAYKNMKEYADFAEIKYLTESKKEKELQENPAIGIGSSKHYLFKDNISLISRELVGKIGTNFLGRNPAMIKVINQAILAAGNSDCSILIRGESGTGKEIIAKLIHYSSSRANEPFVAVNSASFTPGIAQSALFGHLKGAFTGASSRQVGHFEAANKGTIFFDEVGDMPLDIQSALLRVLEEKAILPVGAHKSLKVDFRLISATNKNIYENVEKGGFRLDFMNRINTLEIVIPSLRDRKDDIPILVDYFIEDICSRLQVVRPSVSVSALKMLCDYDYPGNVRELRNNIEKLIIFCKKNEINSEDIFLLQNGNSEAASPQKYFATLNLEELEKRAIWQALNEAGNVKTKAASLLGLTSYSLLRRLKKYDIKI